VKKFAIAAPVVRLAALAIGAIAGHHNFAHLAYA
jgi:hypothetical protein